MHTLGQVKSISIKYLKANGVIVPNEIREGEIKFSDGSVFGFYIDATKEDWYLVLSTTIIYKDGNTKSTRQPIYIIKRPSNLKRGELWYFGCPHSGKAVRTLYFTYQHFEFVSLSSYNIWGTKLYYPIQTVSGLQKLLMQEEVYSMKLDREYEKRDQDTYLNKPIKRLNKIERLEDKLNNIHQRQMTRLIQFLNKSNKVQ